MSKRLRIAVALAVLLGVAAGLWWFTHHRSGDDELVLYGNVDLRQASLAFNGSERIAEILVEEGDVVRKGQLLARLDTSRLAPAVAQAEAQLASQQAVVDRLHHGSRPEEIAQARANLQSAKADAENARRQYERKRTLISKSAVSEQDVDAAKAAAEIADAKVEVSVRALDLAVAGPRVEDIAQAEAQARMAEAQLALLRQQLADAELRAPFDAIVRSRLMEPGEMASPSRPVFSLATRGTKWVRAYISETKLGHIRQGMRAKVITDSFPDRPLDGWIGFISPVAEFTPKNVQTEDLRTSLVYEVRVFVNDKDDTLRLGMPATVRLLPDMELVRAPEHPQGSADQPADGAKRQP
jgi:HlyD family secretion protein